MLIIREKINGLRVIPANRQNTDFLQQSGLGIHMEKTCRIVPGIGAQELRIISGKTQGAGRAGGGMVIIQRGNLLNLLKYRVLSASVVPVDRNIILQLTDHIGKFSASAEFDDPGRRLQFTEQQIQKLDFTGTVVKFIDFDLVGSQIHRAEILSVRRQVHAVYMGAEIPLGHAAQTLMEYLVSHFSHCTVLIETHDCHFAVMPACHEQVSVILIRGQITAAHAFDAGAI